MPRTVRAWKPVPGREQAACLDAGLGWGLGRHRGLQRDTRKARPRPDASRLADTRAQLWPTGSCPTPLAVAVWRRSVVSHVKMPLDLGPTPWAPV